MTKAKKEMPRDRTEQVNAVLSLMSDGMSESGACREVGIDRGTFRAAALKVNAANQYASATENIARDQVEKIETVINEMRDGVIEPAIARIEIDTRKWIAAKLLPRQWGERQHVEHSGALDLTAESDEALGKRLVQSLKGVPREAAVAFLAAKGIDPAVLDE